MTSLPSPTKERTKMANYYRISTLLVLQTMLLASDAHFLNQWAVEVDGGDNSEAEKIAKETGCENKGKNNNSISGRHTLK